MDVKRVELTRNGELAFFYSFRQMI